MAIKRSSRVLAVAAFVGVVALLLGVMGVGAYQFYQSFPSRKGIPVAAHPVAPVVMNTSRTEAARVAGSATAHPADVLLPPLERQREEEEARAVSGATTRSSDIQVDNGFDCATPLSWKLISPTHVEVTISEAGHRNMFLFRVHGVAHKTVRIDVNVQDGEGVIHKWASVVPVFTEADSLDDLDTYDAIAASVQGSPDKSWKGEALPRSDRGKWHFIPNAWRTSYVLSFVHAFDSDSAHVAMRVPYTPGYNAAFFASLKTDPYVQVIEIGRSAEDRPLLMAEVASGDEVSQTQKPCLVMYAGEHADEPDAMWVAEGAIKFLAGDTPSAKAAREKCDFLVVPMLDPDATAAAHHMGMLGGFLEGTRNWESVTYANWFETWAMHGKRLDVVLDLHSVQSGETGYAALMEGLGERGQFSLALHRQIISEFAKVNCVMSEKVRMHGWSPDRLGGWLTRCYGPLSPAYEFDSQAARHLSGGELEQLGTALCEATVQFFAAPEGGKLLADIDSRRMERFEHLPSQNWNPSVADAIQREAEVWKQEVGSPTNVNGNLLHERRVQ